jgi:dihydrofolate synthase / folylpolyglutamate synthase
MPSSFKQASDWLFGLQRFGVKLGLEKVSCLLEKLGDPHRSFVSCHIAGTNGKGTAAVSAESIIRAHGVRCGLYTSPHLVSVCERVRLDGIKVPEAFVDSWVQSHRSYVEEQRITFFEVLTALSFDWFSQAGARAAVVEVGMGGRFDATNVVSPAVCLVTSIALEHTKYLGDTLAKIAAEKAGIAKKGVPLLCGENRGEALEAIRTETESAGARLCLFDSEVQWSTLAVNKFGSRFNYKSPELLLENALLPMVGDQAVRNCCLGIRAAELVLGSMGIKAEPETSADALKGLHWPGRFQRVSGPDGGELVLEVAHNPAAAVKLRENIELVYPGHRAIFVMALAGDKDYEYFLESLLPVAAGFVFPVVDFGRADTGSGAVEPDILAAAVSELSAGEMVSKVCSDMAAALQLVRDESGPVVICGSFHTVGEAMRELGLEP